MKRILFFLLIMSMGEFTNAQSVGIGTTTPNSNAALEIKSNNKGMLMPRTSSSTKNAMANVPKGMIVYDTTYSKFYYHDGNKWRSITDNNTDSLVRDLSSTPQVTANMSSSASTTAISGILYDNGGLFGNYSNNSNDYYAVDIYANDSAVGYKIIIEQMNLESPYDSLEISVVNDYTHKVWISGTTTGTFYFPATNNLRFQFKSNGTNTLSGFRIRWAVLTTTNAGTEPSPNYGWYYNNKKIAVRGGMPGSSNDWATDSLGLFSFAYGIGNKATGYTAMALGNYTTASGIQSTATGNGTIASNYASTAMGASTVASGYASTALGIVTTASGSYSTAIGESTVASGISSTAMGNGTIASGSSSSAMGSVTTASGSSSSAMGYSTTASGYVSTAMGFSTTASGDYSTAMGIGNYANTFRTTAIGSYNTPLGISATTWVATDPLLMIGNGELQSSRSNAMVILKNGNIGIGQNAPTADLHIKHASGGGLILENANDNNKWRIYSASGDNNLTFYNDAGTEVADIDDVTGAFNALSDSRFKKNILSMPAVLPSLMKLNPSYYQFNWQKPGDQRQIGLLAQEAYSFFPELVSYNREKDLYKMNYAGFSTVAIKAIQEQQLQIENQQKQINELIKRLEKLEK